MNSASYSASLALSFFSMRSTSMLSRLPILMNFFRAAELDGGSFSLGLCKIARSQREAFEACGLCLLWSWCAFLVSLLFGCCFLVFLLCVFGLFVLFCLLFCCLCFLCCCGFVFCLLFCCA